MQLIISEKPKASFRIASALADTLPVKKSVSEVPYYELKRKGKQIVVACAVGHLFGLAEKNKTSKYPVEELEWKPKEGFTKKYARVIKQLAKKADDFIIACDYDIEGEIIGYNVLRFLCHQKDAKRMKFSTLTKPELERAYNKASPSINWGQAIAGETRHNLDFMYGISLSRALIQAIKKAGAYKTLSVGRVQGPSLAILANKEKAIQTFKPTPYWQVFLVVDNGKTQVYVAWPKNILKKDELEEFKKLKGKTAEAETIKEDLVWLPLPPFDLTTLQTEAYRALGLTPSQTLQIAQTLYLQGLISYPRTSSQKLPSAIGYRKILQKLLKMFPQWAKTLTRARPIEGKQQDPAHPSIYPTGEKPKQLNETEKALYELILRRFMACFAEDAIVENKRIIVKVDKKQFSSKGLRIRKKGWLDIYPTKVDEILLPDMQGKVKIQEVKTQEKQTQPPKRYTQASLITELTKRKLGTKGTRASIIETLYQRGYIKDKSIVVTNLGLAVEDSLAKYSPLILDEKLTRKFEEQMEKIQQEKDKGKILKEQKKTLGEARKTIEKISAQLKKNEDKIGKELVKGLKITREKERQENILGKCECGGNLLIRYSKKTGKRFVACSNYPKCTITFPLPQKGYIKKSDKKCPKCGRRMITILKKGRRPWTICFAGCGV
ncbi:MAG: DNA topoisomerase I [Thermoplasmata archaeon]|nr:MAG: DNA topoisomerase I [Thermoplasmata archaeon]